MDRVNGLDNKGIYFLPEPNEEDEIAFNMDLISVGDLDHKGILDVNVNLTVSWSNDDLRWDSSKTDWHNDNLTPSFCSVASHYV